MRNSMFVLALSLAVFGTGCQYTPTDGITDPDDNGNDTSDNNGNDTNNDTSTNNPPAGNTVNNIGFDPISSVKGVKVYCQLESDLRRGAHLFLDGDEDINKLSSGGALGYVKSDRMLDVDNDDSIWCQGFVTTQVEPPVWNKLLVDDRGNPNNPTTWGDLEFDGWDCEPKRLIHNEPASADNSWDTQWGLSCSW